jgi:hypothetical protein
MSDYSASPSDHLESQPIKRKATHAGLDGNTTGRSVKRRASKACQCCRARKVRCNVTEHGAPCTNCRLDEVDCIVSESRRKKSVPPPQCSIRTVPPNCRPRRDCRNGVFGFRHVGGLATRSASGDCRSPDRSSPGPSTTAHSSCNDILTHPGNGTRTTNSMPTTQPLRRRQPASSPRATPWRACPASALLHRGQLTQNHASTSMCLTLFVRDGINLVAHPLT